MASSQEYLTYVLELLRELPGIACKRMMGEFMLYQDDVLFGGVYDNRFLIKKTPSVDDGELEEQIPYPSAKPMLLVDLENPQEVKELVLKVISDLKKKSPASSRRSHK